MYKSGDIVINKDSEVSTIIDVIKQDDSILTYKDSVGDVVCVDLDFIQPAIYKYNQLLTEAQKDLKQGEVVQILDGNDIWRPIRLDFKFWETINSNVANNCIVIKHNMIYNDEFLAVKDVRRYNKELVELEGEIM